MDLFFFQGSNADTIAVQAARQSGGNPCIQLFDPDGVLMDGICGSTTTRIDIDLDQTGTYSILVFESSNNSTMGYGLSLERIAPPSASATPINPGGVLSDTIDPVGDMDLFFFQGSNADTIAVQAARQSGGNPCIQLFDPDGVLMDGICGSTTARIDIDLDQTGTYSILVFESSKISRWDMGYR